ncbi:MAG: hypothetical protein ACRD4Y_07595 [Candidatus Acidiferrales bacterium]
MIKLILIATPKLQTVAAGSSATYSIANAGNVPYALTCSSLPPGASCPIPPVVVPVNSSASLVIATAARASGVPFSPGGRQFPNLLLDVVLVLASILFMHLAIRRRAVHGLVPLGALAIVLMLAAAGCGITGGGASSGGAAKSSGTPPGTYTITVTGIAAGLPPESITIVLNVT